jgi:acetylornithine deacetylase/succinyl-diaminopimelate desuccinylase-like protein
MSDRILAAVREERLVQTALELVAISSPTGRERRLAAYVREALAGLGLSVSWQEVERGRPNVLGTLVGEGDGPTLMLNGHMDTSYSGREPWLVGIPGFQPKGFVEDGHIFGLGIANMKGALACYVEAVRALRDAGVRLRGDVLVAAVVGEIEKAQWGEDFLGAEYRGYSAGSRHLVSHGGVADMCILGEPTEGKLVLGHYGSAWLRLSTSGPFVHTAFSGGRLAENAIVRMREVLDAVLAWVPDWEERGSYRGKPGIVNVGSIAGGAPWRASRTPARCDLFLDVRVPPSLPMADAAAELKGLGRSLRERFPDYGLDSELYVTAPGAEIADDHPLVNAIAESHETVFGTPPERDSVHWFSDASVLTRYGIQTVNYGTSSALPGARGENLCIDGLVRTAQVYALTAARVCGVAD